MAIASATRHRAPLREARNERRRATRRRRPFWRRAPAVLPAAQILPLLGAACAQDRLQGCEAAAALHLRARQDRAEPHHRRLDEEAARARASNQARAVPRPLAL